MKVVDVKDQVRLSMGKCVELVLSGVKYRLFRAAITVTIISLAAAFLTAMLTESLSARRVSAAIDQQTWPREQFLLLTNRICLPISQEELTEDLARAGAPSGHNDAHSKDRLEEFRNWGRLEEEDLPVLTGLARRQLMYLLFFRELEEGQRRPLVGRATEIEIIRLLQQPEALEQFKKGLAELGLRGQFPDSDIGEFEGFLAEWKRTEGLRESILRGHAAAVQQVRQKVLKGRDAKELLADRREDLSAFQAALAGCGFRLSLEDLQAARERAALAGDLDRLLRASSEVRIKRGLETRLNKKLSELTDHDYLNEISGAAGAKWLTDLAGELKLSLNVSPARAQEVARWALSEDRLSAVEAIVKEAAGGEGFLGFSQRTLWLLIVSFMVCIVGIANAMLMSVTERFREIATMKCLGATDGFIMINFILESCMQGIAGGFIGAMVGVLLGVLRSWWKYGWMAMQHLPGAEIMTAGGLALVVGVLVSALAAVYPAWVAARLAPMEAMRIE